jgi:hypothetical protein
MSTRLGIEISPAACRIVDIDSSVRGDAAETRVRSFAVLPSSGPDLRAKLASLRGRQASVVVWAEPNEHRQVMVSDGSYESMRKAAMKSVAAAGVVTRGMWADIAPVPGSVPGSRRPVVVALAPIYGVRAALQPILDAGIRLRSVVTPAAALTSLARLRRRTNATSETLECYVALQERATCVALVRDGMLMAARDYAWGFLDELGDGQQIRWREDITARLADELAELFASVSGSGGGTVTQVCVCGALDELRSMTAPLMERLDVEVEPLDSLFGIDATRLPEPADEFRERGAGLRMAWAAAVDVPSPINLLRPRRRQQANARFARAAIAAGVAVGLTVGWTVERSSWWRADDPAAAARRGHPSRIVSDAHASTSIAAPAPIPLRARALNTGLSIGDIPSLPARTFEVAEAPPVALPSAPPITATVAAREMPRVPPPAVMPHVGEPESTTVSRAAMRPSIATLRPVPPALTHPALEPDVMPPSMAPRTIERVVERTRPAPPPPEVALPFDATLGTILYSSDRRLAIIDGRIVGVGDQVRDARVVDITPDSVLLRDSQRRLRRLTASSNGR